VMEKIFFLSHEDCRNAYLLDSRDTVKAFPAKD